MTGTATETKANYIPEPAELLIKEARQKGRRRHRRVALILFAALAAAATLIVSWGGRTGPGTAATGDVAKSTTSRESASTTARLFQAQEISVAGPNEVIVGNFKGVFRTTDGGRQWMNITPPVVAAQPILLSHLDKILTADGNRIWLELSGDAQINFTPYSSNGGRTWQSLTAGDARPPTTTIGAVTQSTGSVPKGLHLRTSYYASPSLAWAQASGPEIGFFTPTYLLRSMNGGRTWTAVST